MKKKIVIFGNGNHCKVVKQEIVKDPNYEIHGIFNYYKNRLKLLQRYKNSKLNKYSSFYAITAIGDNHERAKLVKKVSKSFKNLKWISIISRDSIINKGVKIGKGSIIISGSIININSKVGNHSIINTRSSLDHDNIIGNYSSLAPGTVLAGNVKVGNLVFIGMCTAVKEKIQIENNVKIGANSFVNRNCSKNKRYFGSPIKEIT